MLIVRPFDNDLGKREGADRGGAFGYVLSRPGARKLLDEFSAFSQEKPQDLPVDYWLMNSHKPEEFNQWFLTHRVIHSDFANAGGSVADTDIQKTGTIRL